ncbi:MAG TPA: DUF3662 and FHA domain-containing protein [Coriobacteriia bacterium]|jgi:hypothetical protein
MSILSDFEDRVADAVEGLFAGAFRSPVQPVELAKALAKAMDDGRAVGVGKVYAPLSYTVALSREDRRNLGEFTNTLEGELATYLADHAREQGYTLTAKPHVRFDTHNDLRLGRFRVSADLAATEPAEEEPARPSEALAAPAATAHGVATLSVGDHDVALGGQRLVIGRLRDCDVCVNDVNVSRRHAELVRTAEGWAVNDLGSTNGTSVNGHELTEQVLLREGDAIEVGATRLVYHEPRSGA